MGRECKSFEALDKKKNPPLISTKRKWVRNMHFKDNYGDCAEGSEQYGRESFCYLTYITVNEKVVKYIKGAASIASVNNEESVTGHITGKVAFVFEWQRT